jgi:hypothetical protein
MKKFSKFIISAASILVLSSSVYAEEVNFPAGQSNGSFNCTISDPTATVSIDTDSLEINGGCTGSPFVTSDGHLAGIPALVFQSNYFEITKHVSKNGKIIINVSKGQVNCEQGHGTKPTVFGNGKFCLAK